MRKGRPVNPDEFLTALDEAIGCQQCGGDLTGSVSDEFCTDTCQHTWYAQHAEPLTSYTEAASWEVLRCETAAHWSPPWEWRLPRSTSDLRGDVHAAQRALNEAEHEWQRKAARLRLDSLMERHAATQADQTAALQAFSAAMGESVREAAENFVAGLVEGMRGLEPSFRAAAEAMGEWARIRERMAADRANEHNRRGAESWVQALADRVGAAAPQHRIHLGLDPASPEIPPVATIVHPDGTVYVLPTPARPGIHVMEARTGRWEFHDPAMEQQQRFEVTHPREQQQRRHVATNYLLQASVYARTEITEEQLRTRNRWVIEGYETAEEALTDEVIRPAPVEGGTRRERRERLASNAGRAEAEVRRSHAGPTPRRLDRR